MYDASSDVFVCFRRWFAHAMQYVQTRREMEEAQMKKYEWEQDQIKRACSPPPLRFCPAVFWTP